jgi:uncharacterized NAD-dependent epimerase/dehydratase family protein
MLDSMDTAIVLTAGLLNTSDAKTAHGLIRESNRFKIVGIIDEKNAGSDAGELLDGVHRGIPVLANITAALPLQPEYCIVGVAVTGGIFPEAMIIDVKEAISSGISVVNGLHDYLTERADIVELAKSNGVQLIDIRKPKQRKDLKFWTGKIFQLKTPVVAVLGTDCSMGKRTTTRFLMNDCQQAGINAQMIYTGQTGWLQGSEYGFIFDSTLNDFVAGELEHAVLNCATNTRPDIILIEGQSALRNPSGPCGSEMLVSANARHVILVHAPKRIFYEDDPAWGAIPNLESEIALIKMYGANVIAVALNTEHCTQEEAREFQHHFENTLNMTVILPLMEGCKRIVTHLKNLLIA